MGTAVKNEVTVFRHVCRRCVFVLIILGVVPLVLEMKVLPTTISGSFFKTIEEFDVRRNAYSSQSDL